MAHRKLAPARCASSAKADLVTFQMSLLEWSDAAGDLQTVSIHTYERAPQLVSALSSHALLC